VIAAPTFTHADVAVAALKAGKHVLCEKPLASTLEEAARIAAATEAADGAFLMAFMRRFDAGFAGGAARTAAGDIGEPLLVKSTGRGPGLPPEWAWDVIRSGGLVAEVNSHDLDTVRWLSGQELERVFAVGRAAKRPDIRERYPNFIDLFTATYEMTDDVISPGEARRLACGAGILPAVLDGRSVAVDLGRSARLFTETQRVAGALSHTSCAADGCERAYAWCELHHRHPWGLGGPTDLDNMVPLCGFHHRRVHDRGYDHRWRPDGSVTFHRRT
jgi:predicted dehydrogenase